MNFDMLINYSISQHIYELLLEEYYIDAIIEIFCNITIFHIYLDITFFFGFQKNEKAFSQKMKGYY